MSKIFSFDATLLNNISCPRKGKFSSVMNFRPIDTPTYFDYGDLMHYMLELYYQKQVEGETKIRAKEYAVEQARIYYPKLSLPVPDCEECVANFLAYCTYWHNDTWVPLPNRIEEAFAVPVYEDKDYQWSDSDTGITLVAQGVIDLEIRTENDQEVLVDHKTPSRNREPEKLGYQFPLYCYARNKRKVIINHVGKQKTLKPADKFIRYQRFYSEDWLAEFMVHVVDKVLNWVKMLEAGEFQPDFSSCDKFNGCIYRRVCEQAPRMRDQVLEMYFKPSEPWDPWTKGSKKLAKILEGKDE